MITFERVDEERLRAESGFQSVVDIPNFPFQSFDELRESIGLTSSQRRYSPYSLRFDYEAARQFTSLIGTYSTRALYILLVVIPGLTALTCLGAGPILGHYLIMVGAPIALLGQILGNPVNPFRGFMTWVAAFATLGFLSFVAEASRLTSMNWLSPQDYAGEAIGAWLVGSFVVSFWGNRALYGLNRIVLYKGLVTSEPLFLYLYSKGACMLEDTEARHVWRHRRA